MKYEKMNNLFLRQSYLDSWEDYERSLKKKSFIKWDYIILTASNEAQATAYRNPQTDICKYNCVIINT